MQGVSLSSPLKMCSLEAISAEIEAVAWRKENLRKAFEELQSHSSCLSFPLQWQEVEDHFDPILKSIDESFRDLSSRFFAKSQPSDRDQNQNPTEKKLQEEPSARGLLSLIKKNLGYPPKIERKLTATLRSSSDPAKLGLDVMDGLDDWNGCEFLLKTLMAIAPEIKEEVKERAMGRARKWKEKISMSNACRREARAFVRLVIAFDLASYFKEDELLEAIGKFSQRMIAINFCRKLGLVDRIPDFIQKLISEGKHIAAVSFVCAFELEDKFPPLSLLKSYLMETKKTAQEICSKEDNPVKAQIKSAAKELMAMRVVLKCIGQNELVVGSLQESVEQSIANLKKQQAEMKCKATTASPQPQQQPVKKRDLKVRENQAEKGKSKSGQNRKCHPNKKQKTFHQNNPSEGQKQTTSSVPKCSHCSKFHFGDCYRKTGACYNCGEVGHRIADCPKPKKLQPLQ